MTRIKSSSYSASRVCPQVEPPTAKWVSHWKIHIYHHKASTFRKAGFEQVSLIYTDCSVPCDSIVDRFLRVAESAQGVVAVHCLGGLRSTGTLIGLYLMKHHRFTFCIVARTRECVANLVVFACDCSGAINVRK
jgi:hypothetical protein